VSDNSSKPARTGRWWKYLLILTAVFACAAIALLAYVHTESFQSLVKRRMVAELERLSGGRAEIGSIHTTPFRLQVDVRGLTIHGRETAPEVPLAHVDRIVAQLKISSLLRSELSFFQVILEQPVVHVAFYPDGTTNIPGRRAGTLTPESAIERLFALSIDHLEMRGGQILWDEHKLPLDCTARDVSLQMDYSFLHRRYDGRLSVGLVDTKLPNFRPFAWMTAMQFSLTSNSAVIPSLQWNSGHSHFSASGEVSDFRQPHFQGQYDGQFDLSDAASIARRHDLRGGMLEVKGHGQWSLEHFATEGLVNLHDLAWQDDQISFSRASVTTGYSVTDQQIVLSNLQGKIFGGSLAGDAEWNQWLAPAQHLSPALRREMETATISAAPSTRKSGVARPKPPAFQSAVMVLHLRDLSTEAIAAALNTLRHPLPRLRPAAAASGTLEARWKGTAADAEIQFTLGLIRPAHTAPGQLPLNGHAQGDYDAATGSLDLPQFTLETPLSHVQASGRLSQASAMRLLVSTSSVAEWLPLLEAIRGPELLPVALSGSATFSGNMTGSLSAPQIAGRIEVEKFEVNIPATSRTPALQTFWDSFSASLQASFNSLTIHNATLRRNDSAVDFDGSAALLHGHFTPDSSFNLRANVQNANIGALQALAGYNYPVSGNGDLSLQAGGTIGNPHAGGYIHLANGSAYGESIRQFDAGFRLANGEISFENMHLFHDGALVTGSAAYNPVARSFKIDVTGNNFDLAQLRRLWPDRLTVEGRTNFVLKASGSTQAPSINANVQIQNLTFDRELAGKFDLQAVTEGSELHLTGNSGFQRGSLTVAGNLGLSNGYPINLKFQMDQLDLDALWRSYMRGRLTGHSAVTGSAELSGPLRQPANWTATGTLTTLSLDVENMKLHQQETIRFSVANQALKIDQLHLLGEGTDFIARGSLQLGGDHALDLTADGGLDLKLLSAFDPNFTSTGRATMSVAVGGTLDEPLPQGRFQVTNGAIAYAGLPSGLTELNGSVTFSRDHLHIDTLAARTGGGAVDLKGDATYFNKQLNFSLTGTAKDVRLRYPPGVSSTADAELHWIGTPAASTVSGDIRINKMAVTPGFDFSAYLERSRQLTTVTSANSPLNNIKLDIHVVTAPELQMRTAIARLSGDADLKVRGSVAQPALLGRVDVLEGQATFHGTRFTLERGDITFANPVTIEPQLNLQASTRVRSYDLNVTLTGTPDRGFNLNYRSEPPLPKSDIIALLALGRTSGESEQLQEQSSGAAFSDQASAQILNEALNNTVTSRWQRLFGASNIKIDPQGLTTETNPISNGPQITIEQEFANHVSLTYSTNVSQSSQQIIQGQYYFDRNISAVGTRDQNGVVSFDLLVRRRKK
jgi:translocation and assembly module TamB